MKQERNHYQNPKKDFKALLCVSPIVVIPEELHLQQGEKNVPLHGIRRTGKRHTNVVPTVDRQLLKQSWYKLSKPKLRSLTQTRGLKLKDHSLQMIMHPKTQASTNPEGLFVMAGAIEWAFHFWRLPVDSDCSMEQAWQSVLLVRFDIVRHKPTQQTLMVIAVSDYAFQAWIMKELPGQQAWTMQEDML